MKRILSLGLLLVSLQIFPSCQKNNYQTQAQLTAANLTRVLGSSSGGNISVYNFESGSYRLGGGSYQITSDGMIIVENGTNNSITLNLEALKSYQINNGILFLYF